jgi:hypothetical protein
MNQLIRCITCNELFARTAFDQWPEYESVSGRSSEPYRTMEKDDFQDFLKHHRNHSMENLKVLEDSLVSEKPYIEPTKVSYFKATNGKESFVIKRLRKKIDEPLAYQLIEGDYSLKLHRLEIQSEEIIKQLKRELDTSLLHKDQVEAFLKLYRHILKTIDINSLERIPEDSVHPLEIYYKMDDVSFAYLLRNCRAVFKGQEYKAIETFIHSHREDGVLLLKATYQIQIIKKTQLKKDTLPIPEAVEEKHYVEKK